jgi:hypothetical protein
MLQGSVVVRRVIKSLKRHLAQSAEAYIAVQRKNF